MEIIFLGTSSGKTNLTRNHSSLLIKNDEYSLLIDCGEGTSKSLLKNKISVNQIDSLIITHLHADHYSGVASLVTQMKLLRRKKPFTIYVHQNFTNVVLGFINSTYMFPETIGFEFRVNDFLHDSPINLNNFLSFTAKQNSHIIQKEELKDYPSSMFMSSSLLIRCGNSKIFYTSDVGSIKDFYLFGTEEVTHMIAECSHVSLEEIYTAFKSIQPEKLFITHIDDEIEKQLFEWYSNLEQDDKARIILCHDGLSVNSA